MDAERGTLELMLLCIHISSDVKPKYYYGCVGDYWVGSCYWIDKPCRLLLIYVIFLTSDIIQGDVVEIFKEFRDDYDNMLV